MEIKDKGGVCFLTWNGTKTRLRVLDIGGKLCFEGDSDPWLTQSPKEYFVKIKDADLLEKVMNFLEVIDASTI